MKLFNFAKNIMLSVLLTTLYAIWSEEGLRELSALHTWAILILVGLLILHLFTYIDRELARIQKERKRGKRND